MSSPSSSLSSDLLADALGTFGDAGRGFDVELETTLRAAGNAPLVDRLLSIATDDARRATLIDFIGHAARSLARQDEPPTESAAAAAWDALVAAADALNGSGAHALGRLRFVSDSFFQRLVDEAHSQLSSQTELPTSRAVARAGDTLAKLATSAQLRQTVSRAVGFAVVPTYDALFEYDPPGSHVAAHVDSGEYEIVLHLLLEHIAPGGDGASILTAHLPNTTPARITLRAGESLALRGRGTIHSWRPLSSDERRIMIAVGFRRG